MIVIVETYAIDTDCVTVLSPSGTVFVARSGLSGRPWLRFIKRSDNTGWHVTAHRTKRDAASSFAVVLDPNGEFPAWLIAQPGVRVRGAA